MLFEINPHLILVQIWQKKLFSPRQELLLSIENITPSVSKWMPFKVVTHIKKSND
jgi:hypothetical protein